MDNSSKTRFRVGIVLFGFFATAVAIAGASHQGRGQVDPRAVGTVQPCAVDANSAACLKGRIDQLQSQITELQQQVGTLQQTVGALQQRVGGPQGKADGPDDLWAAIGMLQQRVSKLEHK